MCPRVGDAAETAAADLPDVRWHNEPQHRLWGAGSHGSALRRRGAWGCDLPPKRVTFAPLLARVIEFDPAAGASDRGTLARAVLWHRPRDLGWGPSFRVAGTRVAICASVHAPVPRMGCPWRPSRGVSGLEMLPDRSVRKNKQNTLRWQPVGVTMASLELIFQGAFAHAHEGTISGQGAEIGGGNF